jgi:hypothetical protein
VTLDYARYVNNYAEMYNNTFLPHNNAYLYRHGPSEVVFLIYSKLLITKLSMKRIDSIKTIVMILEMLPLIVIDD